MSSLTRTADPNRILDECRGPAGNECRWRRANERAAKAEELLADLERLTRERDRLSGYVSASLTLARDAHRHLLEERPEEAARTIYRVIDALAGALEGSK